MFRRVLGLALTGSLAVSGFTSAGDDAVKLGRYAAPAAGFAGGVTTASPTQAIAPATSADTQLIFGRRTTYVGVPVYPAYYYPSVYYSAPAYYAPFSYGYYPSYYSTWYSYPYYSASFYYPTYSYGYGFGSYYYGGYWPINGTAATVNTPTVTLVASPRPTVAPVSQPVPVFAPAHDTFRYDGGPSNPIPQPTPESHVPDRIPPASTEPATLRIGLTPPAPKYPAYGDRK